MTYLLWISYKGTRYAGFQVQPNAPTVCAVLQDAMQAVFAAAPTSKAAPAPMPASMRGVSRSASAILAKCRCRKSCPRSRPPAAGHPRSGHPVRAGRLPRALRRPRQDLPLLHFDARVDDPFTYDTCHRVGAALDLAAMQAAAVQFIGTHDFSALCASGSSAAAHGDTVRTITDCTVVQKGDLFTISVTADGYLYNMVRILAGTLADGGSWQADAGEHPRPAGK